MKKILSRALAWCWVQSRDVWTGAQRAVGEHRNEEQEAQDALVRAAYGRAASVWHVSEAFWGDHGRECPRRRAAAPCGAAWAALQEAVRQSGGAVSEWRPHWHRYSEEIEKTMDQLASARCECVGTREGR